VRGRGVFYKAAKPDQDRRIDLPTLGPETLRGAAAAGLGGVAFQAGSVICLDLTEMKRLAGELGLFLWARR
jgi:UDP-2,3-diacylglucosamine hydrolase